MTLLIASHPLHYCCTPEPLRLLLFSLTDLTPSSLAMSLLLSIAIDFSLHVYFAFVSCSRLLYFRWKHLINDCLCLAHCSMLVTHLVCLFIAPLCLCTDDNGPRESIFREPIFHLTYYTYSTHSIYRKLDSSCMIQNANMATFMTNVHQAIVLRHSVFATLRSSTKCN